MYIIVAPCASLEVFVEQQRLADVLDLGNCALEVERLGQDDFEDLDLVSSGMVRSKSVDLTFCTLMLWLVLLKIKLAFMALANRLA